MKESLVKLRNKLFGANKISAEIEEAKQELLKTLKKLQKKVDARSTYKFNDYSFQHSNQINPLEQSIEEEIDLELLQEWYEHSKNYDLSKLQHSQNLIKPYIIYKKELEFNIKFLITNLEGKIWYDDISLSDVILCRYLNMIKKGDVVFDCGANHGYNSLLYSLLVGESGHVYAFDPFPLNADLIRFNALLNRCNNITVQQVGISNQEAEASVSVSTQLVKQANREESDSITIKLEQLDQYVHLNPTFIKIDVEGSEINALAGASKILETLPNIYIETHPTFLPKFGGHPMQIFDYISIDQYNCYISYPGKRMTRYNKEFELVEPCALYFVKEEDDPLVRLELPE